MKSKSFGLNLKILAGLLVLLGIGVLAIYVREGGFNLSGASVGSGVLKVEAVSVGGADLTALKTGDKYKLRVTFRDRLFGNKTVQAFWSVPYGPGYLSTAYRLDRNGEIEFTVSEATAPGPYVLQRLGYSYYSARLDTPLNVLLPAADVSAEAALQVSIESVGGAYLNTLKSGDKYRLKVLSAGQPLADKSVDVAWSVPVKYSYYTLENNPSGVAWKEFTATPLLTTYRLDGNGEIEFTVSETTTPGAYHLESVSYQGSKTELSSVKLWVLEPGAITVEVIPVAGANLKALNIGNKYRLKVSWAYERKAPLAYRQVKATWSVPYGSGTDSATYTLDRNGEIEFAVSKATTPGNYVLKSVESATYYAAPAASFTVLPPAQSNIRTGR